MKTSNKNQDNWCDWSLLPPPPIQLRRYDMNSSRFYYYLGYDGDNIVAKTAIGITSLLAMVMPSSSFLTDWKIQNTNYEELLDASSSYGSLLHQIYGLWLTEKRVDYEVMNAARTIAINQGQSANMVEKDLLAFLKFVEDYSVEPLLIEGMLLNGEVAQTVDLLAKMKVTETVTEMVEDGVYQRGEKKGQPKYVENKIKTKAYKTVLVDHKSNFFEKDRKSFYDSHKFQLMSGKRAVEENYPQIKVDLIMNFSPNSWKLEPSYTTKIWQTTEEDEQLLDMYIEMGRLQGLTTPSGNIFIAPEFTPNTRSCDYRMISYTDYALEQLWVDRTPPEFLDSPILDNI